MTKTVACRGYPRARPEGRTAPDPGPRSTLRFGCTIDRMMARPRQGEVKDQRVNFRLTLEEAITLRERAARAGKSMSDYARDAALGPPIRRPALARPFAMEPASFHQIRRLGVNLNQIAHRLNALDLPPPPELAPLIAEIQATLRKALATHDP